MNTILISGTVNSYGNQVQYNVHIYAAKEGEQIQFVSSVDNGILFDYNELWRKAKNICAVYLDDNKLKDGAYTQFLDHLIKI